MLAQIQAERPQPKRLVEAAGTTIDKDEDEWRPLTGDSKRDLSPIQQTRMQKLARYQWESNLLANAIIELPVAYLLAQGVALQSKDDDAQALLDRFWHDPINEMDLKLPKKVRELSIYGEQCYPAFVGIDGQVRIGYLNPCLIETVVLDPDNTEQPIGIVTVKDKKGEARRFKVIINGPESVFTARTQQIRETFDDGQCFFFKVNDLSDGSRGRSDLLAQIDWLDAYEDYLFGELDRAKFMRSYIWDVTLKGATEEQVKARARDIHAPSPGAVRVHNDSELWGTETPSLQAGDSSEMAKLVRNHVLGGARIPSYWFGGGEDANRSTAGEMSEPTFKSLSMRQRYLKYMLEMMGRFVVLSGARVKQADAQVDASDDAYKIEAVFPEMVSRDTTKYASAFAQCVVGASAAIAGELCTRETALGILASIASNFGLEIDVAAELAAVDKEVAARKTRQTEEDTLPPIPAADEEVGGGSPAPEPEAA